MLVERPCCRRYSTSTAELREVWDKPANERTRPGAAAITVDPNTLRDYLSNTHQWKMQRIFGDPMSSTPPSAKHLFYSCGVIEGLFLSVNIITMSPFIFEMCMPYHLKYTGLILSWWGGTYVGMNVARYGPLTQPFWYGARAAIGFAFVILGFSGMALADGIPGAPKLGPWPSYGVLMTSFCGLAIFDIALHRRQMIPPWLLKWKMGISGLIIASLLLGIVKGRYLEYHARDLIMAQALRDEE